MDPPQGIIWPKDHWSDSVPTVELRFEWNRIIFQTSMKDRISLSKTGGEGKQRNKICKHAPLFAQTMWLTRTASPLQYDWEHVS